VICKKQKSRIYGNAANQVLLPLGDDIANLENYDQYRHQVEIEKTLIAGPAFETFVVSPPKVKNATKIRKNREKAKLEKHV